MEAQQSRMWDFAVVASALIGCLGPVVHNVAISILLLSPFTLTLVFVYLLPAGVWFAPSARRTAAVVLFVWGSISLILGGIGIMPAPLHVTAPEPPFTDLGLHVFYAVTQLPLILVTAFWLSGARAVRLPERGE
jgi:hypothetical protein